MHQNGIFGLLENLQPKVINKIQNKKYSEKNKCNESCKDNMMAKDTKERKAKQIACQKISSIHKKAPQADNLICKELIIGKAYEARNVYKSIIRHIHTYVKRTRDHLT